MEKNSIKKFKKQKRRRKNLRLCLSPSEDKKILNLKKSVTATFWGVMGRKALKALKIKGNFEMFSVQSLSTAPIMRFLE